MTDKPTPEQIQRACDLATCYNPVDYRRGTARAFTALADTIAQLDAMQEERDKATADLGAIANKLGEVGADTHRLSNTSRAAIGAARDLAAPYRVETDPLEAEADKLMAMDQSTRVIVLSALKRGLEIGRAA